MRRVRSHAPTAPHISSKCTGLSLFSANNSSNRLMIAEWCRHRLSARAGK
jgi:hypothetical protein